MFLSNIDLFFTVREKVLNKSKNRLLLIKNLELKLEPQLEQEIEPELELEPKPKYRKFSSKLREEFLYENLNKDEKI